MQLFTCEPVPNSEVKVTNIVTKMLENFVDLIPSFQKSPVCASREKMATELTVEENIVKWNNAVDMLHLKVTLIEGGCVKTSE